MRKLSLLAGALAVAVVAGACIGTKPGPPPPSEPPSAHRDVVVFGDSNAWGIGCSLGDDAGFGASWCAQQGGITARNETEGTCSITPNVALFYDRIALPALCNDWATKWPAILDEATPKLVILNTGGWEIVDRWSTFPSGPSCSTNNAFNCDEPDLQWGGDPTKLTAAKNAYEDQLNAAIDLFRAKGAKVLVVNSPYYAPTEAQIPAVPVWYEPYSPTAPANWIAPNGDPAYTYRSSKTKIDQFNAAVQEVVAQRDPAFVQPFDLWALVSPNGQYDPSNREADRVHLTQAAFQNIILSNLLPVIQQMLS